MTPLRKCFFWIHLAAGLLAGVIILVMSVTGVLLTYERQMIAWSDGHLRSVPQPGSPPMGPEKLLEKFQEALPGKLIASVTMGSDPEAPVLVSAGGKTYGVNAWSGRILGEPATEVRQWMSNLRAWHRWLAVEGDQRPMAKAVTGWSNVIFAGLALTGLVLWFPRKWKWPRFRSGMWFQRGLGGKARDFNWHNVIGFWSTIPLLVVVVSAMPISFPWAGNAVYRAFGETPPAPRGSGGGGGGSGTVGNAGGGRGNAGSGGVGNGSIGSGSIGSAVGESRRTGPDTDPAGPGRQGERGGNGGNGGRAGGAGAGAGGGGGEADHPAESQAAVLKGIDPYFRAAVTQVADWKTVAWRVPAGAESPMEFAIDAGNGGQPHLKSKLVLDRVRGGVVSWEAFDAQTPARQTRSILRFAHTGEVAGIPGQTLAGLASLGGVVLVWTGFSLSARRFAAWRRRR